MHKCELTNEQLLAAIEYDRKLAAGLGIGPETRVRCAQLASALQELLERRHADQIAMLAWMHAYHHTTATIETLCDVVAIGEDEEPWFDIGELEGKNDIDAREEVDNAVFYLNLCNLIERHPECASWVRVKAPADILIVPEVK